MTEENASLEEVRPWTTDSPYARALGVRLESLGEGTARLRLPYADHNANPGQALHGGCAASLAAIGAQTVSRAALGSDTGPFVTAGLHVNYLAAAIGEDVVADAELERRGKGLCFAHVRVATAEGKAIAQATAAVRARGGAATAEPARSSGDDGAAEPGPMGAGVEKLGFIAARGIKVEHMSGGTSRLVMPPLAANEDWEGATHEGAVLALLDTAGAMASWGLHGIGRYKASTPSIQAQVLAPAPAAELIAYGRVAQRDGEIFWTDVEIATASGGHIVARGTVLYRIVS